MIANKIKRNEAPLFYGTYMQSNINFEENVISITIPNSASIILKQYVYDEPYPNKNIKYYEHNGTQTYLEFSKDLIRKLKVKLSAIAQGDIAYLSLLVKDYTERRKQIKYKSEIFIAYEDMESLKSTHVSYDELRDAIRIIYDQANETKYIILGVEGLKGRINYVPLKEKIYLNGKVIHKIAEIEGEIKLDKALGEVEYIISDDIDKYDASHLYKKTSSDIKKVFETNIKEISATYNVFYNYLENALIQNNEISTLKDLYLYGKTNSKATSKTKFGEIALKEIKNKKINWLSYGDEEILGKSLLHTLLLANKLIDENEKDTAYKLIKQYAQSFYDIFALHLTKNITYSKEIIFEMLLYIRAINKMFLDMHLKSNTLELKTYLPEEIKEMSFKELHKESLFIRNASISKQNIELNIIASKNLKKLNIRIQTPVSIIQKSAKFKESPPSYYANINIKI